MNIFYSDNIQSHIIRLDKVETNHCIKVLRNNIGDEVLVTDGGPLTGLQVVGVAAEQRPGRVGQSGIGLCRISAQCLSVHRRLYAVD